MIVAADPVGLLCDLIEAGGSVDATVARERFPREIAFLSGIGAATAGPNASVVTCRACDEDHPANLKFEPTTRRNWHFCPTAGRVWVDDALLATLHTNPEWLVKWLADALPLTPPVRSYELCRDVAWHCGEAHVNGTALAVVFATGVSRLANLEALAAAIPPVPAIQLGIVLTTTPNPPRRIALPQCYHMLDLRQIIRLAGDALTIDRPAFAARIKAFGKGLAKPARLHAGRPSESEATKRIFEKRRAQNIPMDGRRAEARAIRAVMEAEGIGSLPEVKTIERHLREPLE